MSKTLLNLFTVMPLTWLFVATLPGSAITFAAEEKESSSVEQTREPSKLEELKHLWLEVNSSPIPRPFSHSYAEEAYLIADQTEELTPEERKALAQADPSAMTAATGHVYERLKAWYIAALGHQGLIDRYIIAKQSFLMVTTHEQLLRLVAALPQAKQKTVESLLVKLEEHYRAWYEHRNTLTDANPKLHKQRLYNFHDYFGTAEKLAQCLGIARKTQGQGPAHDEALRRPQALAGMRFVFSALGQILKTSLSKSQTKTFKVATSSARTWSKLQKFPISIAGRANLDRPNMDGSANDENVIDMILPSHRSTAGDFLLLASLELEDAIVFTNTRSIGGLVCPFAPDWAANKIAGLRGVVAVGSCRGKDGQRPTERLMSCLSTATTRKVINYPQGFVANFDEILPFNCTFSDLLLTPLLQAGYGLRILPVSYEIDSAFLESEHDNLKKGAGVIVHKALTPAFVKLLVDLEGNGFQHLVSMIVRSVWLDHIVRYPQLSLQELDRRISSRIGIKILPREVSLPL